MSPQNIFPKDYQNPFKLGEAIDYKEIFELNNFREKYGYNSNKQFQIHYVLLDKRMFKYLKQKDEKLEFRVFGEKSRLVKKGDVVIFKNADAEEYCKVFIHTVKEFSIIKAILGEYDSQPKVKVIVSKISRENNEGIKSPEANAYHFVKFKKH